MTLHRNISMSQNTLYKEEEGNCFVYKSYAAKKKKKKNKKITIFTHNKVIINLLYDLKQNLTQSTSL